MILSMDTLSKASLQQVAQEVEIASTGLPIIHTVTATLDNGGITVTISGFTSEELDEEITVERRIS
jgi:hypothetical protein